MGKKYLDGLVTATSDTRDSLVTQGVSYYTKAGEEFAAALATKDGARKKLQKFVRNNRGHYWVENYNAAIGRQDDQDFEGAELLFRIARVLDPNNLKAYTSGAGALVHLNRLEESMQLVKNGLAIDPTDKKLLKVQSSLVHDLAGRLAEDADKNKDPAKLLQALQYYDSLIGDNAKDPNLFFERGLAQLAGGDIVEKTSPDSSRALYERAAEDFATAASFVDPDGDQRQFLIDCKFNRLQALSSAREKDKVLAADEEYVCLQPTDPAGWQFLATARIDADDQDGAVAALMMAKSLSGSEVPLDVALQDPKGDSKAAFKELGKPDHVFTYQEASSGNQIETWIWLEKKKAKSFILGVHQGEVTWCP